MMKTVQREALLCPYNSMHKRYFDFSKFEMIGREFLIAFARGFIVYSSSIAPGTAQSRYNVSCYFLRWLVANQRELPRLTSALATNHTCALDKDWEDAYELWKGEILNKQTYRSGSKYAVIKNLCVVLRRMAIFGVLPKIILIAPSTKLRDARRPRRTLAELSRHESKKSNKTIAGRSLTGIGGPAHVIENQKDFIAALSAEEGELARTPVEQAKALMKLNADRLSTIRACACKDFITWRNHLLEGQRLLEFCDMGFEEIESVLSNKYPDKMRKGRATGSLFPRDNPGVSIARLLTFFMGHPEYRGQMSGHPQASLGWFRGRAHQHGNIGFLQAYLFPHAQMTIAAGIIVLCDTGANMCVARTLSVNCLQDSKELGYKTLIGVKMRASGKFIVDELPVKDPQHEISCVEVIETYHKLSQRMRALCSKEITSSLFLTADNAGPIRPISTNFFHNNFKRFCKRHPELQGLDIQPTMIRPSVLMKAAFDKDANIITAATIGDHASMSTTYGYISRFPIQVIWESKIRRFQALFQSVSINSVQGTAKKLGLTDTQVEKFLNQAHRTGLGILCLDPKQGIQPGSKMGETCTELQSCPTCPNVLVIAKIEILSDLILWNSHLQQSRQEWESARPERWEKVWLPWLVFTQVVIEQASRGRTMKMFMAAKAFAAAQADSRKINLPPLW